MPVLWRYLIWNYLKVFFLSIASFIAILLTLRLGEIASFTTLGPDSIHIFWFILQQIPYVLPIAFPISALIASLLLFQELSNTHEITALRSSGYSLQAIFTPIITLALMLSLLNFYIISEVSTKAHLNTSNLKNQLRSVNPLLLLNNKFIMNLKGLYFDTLGHSCSGEFAEEIILLVPANKHERLSLIVSKKINVEKESFSGRFITILSSKKNKKNNEQEHLLIENMASCTSSLNDFSLVFAKKSPSINNDQLNFRELLIRKHNLYQEMETTEKEKLKQITYKYNEALSEIIRRLSAAFSVFTFSLLGCAYGLHISRTNSHTGIFFVLLLASLYLVCFLVGKSFGKNLIATGALYIIPHFIICLASFKTLKKISHGIE